MNQAEEGWPDKNTSWRKEEEMEEYGMNTEVMFVYCSNQR